MKLKTALLDTVRMMDAEALTELYCTYAPVLHKYIMRSYPDPLLADYIVADVFARLLDQLSCGSGPSVNLRAYLFEIAYHILVDQVRYARRHQSLEHFDRMKLDASAGWLQIESHLLYQEVQRAMERELTDYQRQVIILRYVEGLSLHETAVLLGKTVNIIKAAQNRAIVTLRKSLHPWAVA